MIVSLGLRAKRLGIACAMLGAALLTACASDGNSGGTITPPTTPAAPPPPPPPPPPPAVPDPNSGEYQESYSLAAIHAIGAYNNGGTGQGIIVGVIDSGVDSAQADLIGAVSNASTDVVAGRNTPIGVDPHATYIAGIIASRFNGMGTIGVAYDSTILSVRTDDPGTCTSDPKTSNCAFGANNLAQGIDYARTHGAKVINLSIGGDTPFGANFEAALLRAVTANIIITASAGNNSAADPDYPGRYLTDARYAGLILAVGATDQTNTLTSYSDKAGVASGGYLVAPGDQVITNCTNGRCWQVSGTSFSAPQVAGAAALMLQAFPNLTPQQVVKILLQTADDLGAPGVDAVYGYGLLDLAKAFAPIGSMSIPMAGAVSVPEQTLAGSSLGEAFGDAFQATAALTTVGFDAYQRRYQIDLAQNYRAVRPSLVGAAAEPQVQQAQVVTVAKGVRLSFSAGRSQEDLSPASGTARLSQQQQSRNDLNLEIQTGRFSFAAWRGEGGTPPSPTLAASSNAFASLTRPDQAVHAAYSLGALSFSAEMGSGGHRLDYGWSESRPSSYSLASVELAKRTWALSLSGGRLDEPEGPLGSVLPVQTSFAMPALTDFVTLNGDWEAPGRLTLFAEASVGRTRTRGALLTMTRPIISSSWRLSARTRCAADQNSCTHLQLDLSQPVRVESGIFSVMLADVPEHYFDPLSFSRRNFSASPSGRELDLRLGVDRNLPDLGLVQLQLVGARDPGNIASRPMSLGVVANWSARF